MAGAHFPAATLLLLLAATAAAFLRSIPTASAAVGVNWGTLQSHKLAPPVVVKLLRDNKIGKVKLFEADPQVLRALRGSRIEVMVGIPNEMLAALGSSPAAADSWVAHNVSRYTVKGGVDIRYVAVGNEPFLASYQGKYQPFVLPALTNLQQSLSRANLAGFVKLLVPCNADAYEGPTPSQGTFRPELAPLMSELAAFLSSNGSPFVVNIYPFLSLYQSADFPQDYAFFSGSTHSVTDGQSLYSNAFDGNFDTLVAALGRIGYGQMPVIVGEVGWPTEGGGGAANLSAARAFNQGLVNHILSGKGTPLRPNSPPVDVYLFSLLDEDQKDVLPGNFERHWGIFSFDGQAKYPLNLGSGTLRNAEKVNYLPARWCVADPSKEILFSGGGGGAAAAHLERACSAADCTTLLYGGSFLDPSEGACRFLVGLSDSGCSCGLCGAFCSIWVVSVWAYFVFRSSGFS